MKRIILISALLVLSSNAFAHPPLWVGGSEALDMQPEDNRSCSNDDVTGIWKIFHPYDPDNKKVKDPLEPEAYLAIDYDRTNQVFSALLVKSSWRVDGEPKLVLDCHTPPRSNAVLSLPIQSKSDPGTKATLCVEKVRRSSALAKRNASADENPSQIAIYPAESDDDERPVCLSYHGDSLVSSQVKALRNESAPVTPGHSHADN